MRKLCSRLRRYPGRKEEQWWLVLGDTKANTLLAIKRVKLGRASNATLSFVAPAAPGPARLMLYFMCDSYMGADQEYEVRVFQPCRDSCLTAVQATAWYTLAEA